MNHLAVDKGANAFVAIDVPADWATTTEGPGFASAAKDSDPDFIKNILKPINAQMGNDLPVSAFAGREDGAFENGSAAYEKTCYRS